MEDHVGAERRGKMDWHLEKSISIAEIITTLSIVAALLLGWAKMDTRTTLLEADVVYLKQSDLRLENAFHDDVKDIKAAMIRMEQKLDGNKNDRGKQ